MSSPATYLSKNTLSSAKCIDLLEFMDGRMPGFSPAFGKESGEAEMHLDLSWSKLAKCDWIEFFDLRYLRADFPAKVSIEKTSLALLSNIPTRFPKFDLHIKIEFELKNSLKKQHADILTITFEEGKFRIHYLTRTPEIRDIEKNISTVIAAFKLPINVKKHSSGFKLALSKTGILFDCASENDLFPKGVNPISIHSDTLLKKPEDLSAALSFVVDSLGNGRAAEASWWHSDTTEVYDLGKESPWRAKLKFFAKQNFPSSNLEIETYYKIKSFASFEAMKSLGIKDSWFRTPFFHFKDEKGEPAEVFVYTTPKGHRLGVTISDKMSLNALAVYIRQKFIRTSLWD